jgi:hypothetical protein
MCEDAGSVSFFIETIIFDEGIVGPVVPVEVKGDFNAPPDPVERFFIIANCIATATS